MRFLWMDLLKILAIFGVILLHVSAPLVVPFEDTRDWWVGNIYDASTRWCVPLFVMVSGALLLGKAGGISLWQSFRSRVGRILIPFVSWSAVYFYYRIHFKGDHEFTWWDFFPMLLTEPVYYHLWFVYMLIVLYLFAPVISVFVNNSPARHAWYLVALWFLWTSLLPIIDEPLDIRLYYTPEMDEYSALRLSGYFLLGYMLKDHYILGKTRLLATLVLFLAALAVTIVGTYFLSANQEAFNPFFYKYHSAPVVIMTIALYLMVKSLSVIQGRPAGSPLPIQQIGMGVFGIYLAHAMVLELFANGSFGFVIDHTRFFGAALPPATGLPLFAVSIFVCSLVLVLIIRYIPLIRDIFT